MPKRTTHFESNVDLRIEYLMYAPYFFYRATGTEDNMLSALMRSKASDIETKLKARSVDIPSPDEVLAKARDMFHADQIHEWKV